jgi:hypothetical protein
VTDPTIAFFHSSNIARNSSRKFLTLAIAVRMPGHPNCRSKSNKITFSHADCSGRSEWRSEHRPISVGSSFQGSAHPKNCSAKSLCGDCMGAVQRHTQLLHGKTAVIGFRLLQLLRIYPNVIGHPSDRSACRKIESPALAIAVHSAQSLIMDPNKFRF